MSVTFEPIGTIHSPFQTKEGMPIQSGGAKGIKGHIVLNEDLVPGLKDLDGFSHVILICHFHRSEGYELLTTPFLDRQQHGVFATRAPRRPNPIGLSVVRLTGIHKNILYIEGVDVLDGTPLLDIKPYIPDFDVFETKKNGWTTNKTGNLPGKKSDARFG